MVTASTRTIASAPSLIEGSGTSCQEVCPGPWKTSAFMARPSLCAVHAVRCGSGVTASLCPGPAATLGPVGPPPGTGRAPPARPCRYDGEVRPPSREAGKEGPAHADADADAGQVIDWLRTAPPPHTACLVHGEESAAETLRDRITDELGWTAVVPRSGVAVLVR
ncbi:hypothetical protein IPZ70_01625 [Streptomyces polychromogenes]|nr:hypothetical protein [Streptomyces polychromogenes]